jgi:hypothetical protein
MKRRLLLLMCGVLIALVLAAGVVQAMESTNFAFNWYPPLTASGGALSKSDHFGGEVFLGQTAVNVSSSTNFQARLGYWPGVPPDFRFFAPVVRKNVP